MPHSLSVFHPLRETSVGLNANVRSLCTVIANSPRRFSLACADPPVQVGCGEKYCDGRAMVHVVTQRFLSKKDLVFEGERDKDVGLGEFE